jgi:hypothetical protein
MRWNLTLPALALCGLAAALAGCHSSGGVEQLTFDSPQGAVEALTYVAETHDEDYAREVFGPEHAEFSTGDPEVDAYERTRFHAAITRRHELRLNDDGSYDVLVGEDAVVFPAPIVEHEGRWMFDTIEGLERLEDLRIGMHELRTIAFLRLLPAAQREYRSLDRDGDGVLEYAQRYESTPGARDGLYWPTSADEPHAPLGAYHARAEAPWSDEQGYNGYFFQLLEAQGPGAPGGARSYLDARGNLVGGFAVLAYPAVYGETGVFSFKIAADGVVYEKDLGPGDTPIAPKVVTVYAPADGWAIVED